MRGYFFVYLSSYVNFGFEWLRGSNRIQFLSAIMGLAASLLGLVLAASTFLVGHVQHERFKLLRQARSWAEFPKLVSACLWRLLVLTIMSGIFCILNDEMFEIFAPALIFLIVISGLALTALVWIVSAIIAIQDL